MGKDEPMLFGDVDLFNDANIILADDTDDRLEHLNRIGIKAKLMKSNFEVSKNLEIHITANVLAKTVAEQKVNNVAEELMEKMEKYDVIMGFHTVIALDKKTVSKPSNSEDALIILKQLNDHEHSVITGVSILRRERNIKTFSVETKVKYNEIPEEMFERYVQNDEWRHCSTELDIFAKSEQINRGTSSNRSRCKNRNRMRNDGRNLSSNDELENDATSTSAVNNQNDESKVENQNHASEDTVETTNHYINETCEQKVQNASVPSNPPPSTDQ